MPAFPPRDREARPDTAAAGAWSSEVPSRRCADLHRSRRYRAVSRPRRLVRQITAEVVTYVTSFGTDPLAESAAAALDTDHGSPPHPGSRRHRNSVSSNQHDDAGEARLALARRASAPGDRRPGLRINARFDGVNGLNSQESTALTLHRSGYPARSPRAPCEPGPPSALPDGPGLDQLDERAFVLRARGGCLPLGPWRRRRASPSSPGRTAGSAHRRSPRPWSA